MLLIRNGLVFAYARAEPRLLDILIDGRRIETVKATIDPPAGATVIDATGHLVVPGFINAHTHGRESFLKGYVDNRPLELWLHELARYSRHRGPEEEYVSACLNALEQLKSGITSAHDLYTHLPLMTSEITFQVLAAYRDVGLRAVVSPAIADVPYHRTLPGLDRLAQPSLIRELDQVFLPSSADEQLGVVREVALDWKTATESDRVRVGIGPVIPVRCTDELLSGTRDLANELNLLVHTHLAETSVQEAASRVRHRSSNSSRLNKLGLLHSRMTAAHAIWLEESDFDLLASTGVNVVHNPMSNLKLGSGRMSITAMQRAGVSISIGTDGSGSSDNQNIFEAMRLATYLHRPFIEDYEDWPRAEDVLEAMWEGGARALGHSNDLGRLEEGYLADLVLLTLDTEAFSPLNSVARQLVMCESGASVRLVIINGEVVLQDGVAVRVDEQKVRQEARTMAETLRSHPAVRAQALNTAEQPLREAWLGHRRHPSKGSW